VDGVSNLVDMKQKLQ